jgi:hypothetical protein
MGGIERPFRGGAALLFPVWGGEVSGAVGTRQQIDSEFRCGRLVLYLVYFRALREEKKTIKHSCKTMT